MMDKNSNGNGRPDLSIRAFLLPKISAEGIPVLSVMGAAAMLLAMMSDFLGTLAIAATVFAYYFFRDPERVAPDGDGLVLAPADGRVLPVVESALPPELKMGAEKYVRISIFMSVFDVHVNRSPVSGRVLKSVYVAGKFFNADMDKASKHNERNIMLIETDGHAKVCCVQIAGLVARRIVSRAKAGDSVKAGERFGLIKFGSRLDVYLPRDKYRVLVKSGQSTIAGETVIAEIKSK
ncbi:MAG: phosphatidylserine decarboxylase [Rickettsiales bacterium]|jgi:phosphatidylserine decarboxylase|nr:phosphatidylserine decarboxylase [Rickettsiales bacterium]